MIRVKAPENKTINNVEVQFNFCFVLLAPPDICNDSTFESP